MIEQLLLMQQAPVLSSQVQSPPSQLNASQFNQIATPAGPP
jgi:hypothetical protein